MANIYMLHMEHERVFIMYTHYQFQIIIKKNISVRIRSNTQTDLAGAYFALYNVIINCNVAN